MVWVIALASVQKENIQRFVRQKLYCQNIDKADKKDEFVISQVASFVYPMACVNFTDIIDLSAHLKDALLCVSTDETARSSIELIKGPWKYLQFITNNHDVLVYLLYLY